MHHYFTGLQGAKAVGTGKGASACEALYRKHTAFLSLPAKFQFEVTFMAMMRDQLASDTQVCPFIITKPSEAVMTRSLPHFLSLAVVVINTESSLLTAKLGWAFQLSTAAWYRRPVITTYIRQPGRHPWAIVPASISRPVLRLRLWRRLDHGRGQLGAAIHPLLPASTVLCSL